MAVLGTLRDPWTREGMGIDLHFDLEPRLIVWYYLFNHVLHVIM